MFPPGTKIAEDAAGAWILLASDGSPTSFRMPKNGYYFDDMSFNRGARIDPGKFLPLSDIPDEHLNILAQYGRSLYENTDYAILGWGFGVCFLGLSLITDRASNVTQGLPNEWMMMLMNEEETCHEMMDRSVEATIKCLGLVKQAVGDYCFAWASPPTTAARSEASSSGRNFGPKCSSRTTRSCATRSTATPRGRSFSTLAAQSTASCRISSRRGLTFSTRCRPRSPTWLRTGSSASSATAWSSGAAGAIRKPSSAAPRRRKSDQHVKERIAAFSPNGGYVFNQVHNIQANVPPKNILAMFDAAYEFGGH